MGWTISCENVSVNAGSGLLACLALEGNRALNKVEFNFSENGPAIFIGGFVFLSSIILLMPVIDNLERIVFYFVKKWERVKIAPQGEDPDLTTEKKTKEDSNSINPSD